VDSPLAGGLSPNTRLHPTPPWQSYLPGPEIMPFSAGFTLETYYLTGLTYTLLHAPGFARSQAFAAQAVDWLMEELRLRQGEGKSAAQKQTVRAFDPAQHLDGDQEISMQINASVPLAKTHPPQQEHGADGAPGVAPLPTKTREAEPISAEAADESSGAANGRSRGRQAHFQFGSAQPFPEGGIQTGLAGALYLVNLLAWLDLPNGWDGRLARCLSGWGAIEALTRGLLGADHDRYSEDSLWSTLKLLDSGFSPAGPPESYRLPLHVAARCCTPHPRWIASVEGGRGRLYDETGGFLLVDSPGTLAADIEAYRTVGIDPAWHWGAVPALQPLAEDIARALSPATAWWLERSFAPVQALLERLLDAQAGTLAGVLLCHAGRLVVTRTHVDLVLSTDSICLPARRAGMDRDPGWVPDLGRIVLFHFE
jgi:hypothetical protein